MVGRQHRAIEMFCLQTIAYPPRLHQPLKFLSHFLDECLRLQGFTLQNVAQAPTIITDP
jgi:hypothetical protein